MEKLTRILVFLLTREGNPMSVVLFNVGVALSIMGLFFFLVTILTLSAGETKNLSQRTGRVSLLCYIASVIVLIFALVTI